MIAGTLWNLQVQQEADGDQPQEILHGNNGEVSTTIFCLFLKLTVDNVNEIHLLLHIPLIGLLDNW